MPFFKVMFCAVLFLTAVPVSAESISEAAARISKKRDAKAELEKDKVKIGENIDAIGNMTIEDFLELEAVPDGLDAVSAQTLDGAPQSFDFMTTEQALKSIAVMRKQGIELPKDLEKEIKKNPDKASELMNDAFAKIPPAEVKTKEDIAKQRKAAIKDAENTLGFKFKDVLEQQKEMMKQSSSSKGNGRRRGKKQ